MVAMYLMIDTGLMSPIRVWLRRAERLTEGSGTAPVHAVVAMVRTYERLWCGDMEGAGANARQAVELGQHHGVAPAVLIGNVATARLHIFEGNTEKGIEMLDDVAVSLASGEVDAMTSGMAYCELICAAQGLALYDRAGEWTQAMDHWRQRFRLRRVRRPLPSAPRGDAPALRPVRPRRAGGARSVRGAPSLDAAGVRLAADRARQHPAPEG